MVTVLVMLLILGVIAALPVAVVLALADADKRRIGSDSHHLKPTAAGGGGGGE